MARKAAWKGGCSQDWLPHNKCRIPRLGKVSGIGLKPGFSQAIGSTGSEAQFPLPRTLSRCGDDGQVVMRGGAASKPSSIPKRIGVGRNKPLFYVVVRFAPAVELGEDVGVEKKPAHSSGGRA